MKHLRQLERSCWDIRKNILNAIGEDSVDDHGRYGRKRFNKDELEAIEDALT